MRQGRRSDLPEAGAAAARPLYLIHRNKVPKPSGTRAPGRLVITLQDPEGLPLGDALKLLRGDLSPLGYLFLRRAVHGSTKTT